MPRRPMYQPVRNPMANRRGFIAFIVSNLEFQTYFDPTTMTRFGLGQVDEPVKIRRYGRGYNPQPSRPKSLMAASARERLYRDLELNDFHKNDKLYARQRRSDR